ncbi:MAG: flippase-like domain-containing protein [Acidobacteria bacterium]|nr:flippase-like domain-containing protein [Acidobacteriota bacterium]MCI0621674.1 flippase-like domain-containing protein [Acidobacteriota bacterium]MCI0718264.1 flippase-like domain-containing protein [Acidobacteriota bacterium]
MNNGWKIFRLLVTLSLIGLVFFKVDGSQVWGNFRKANLFWLLLALPYPLITLALGVTRWRLLLRALSCDIDWVYLYRTHLIGLFFNNFSPGDLGSDVYRTLRVSRIAPRNDVVRAVICDRFCGWLSLIVLGLFAILQLRLGRSVDFLRSTFFLLIGVLAGFTVVMLAIILLCQCSLLTNPQSRWLRRALEFLRLYEKLLSFRILSRAAMFSVAVHAVVISVVVLLAKAYGVPNETLWNVALVAPVGLAITMLPISIAGHGIRESSFVVLFPLIGVSSEVALAMALTLFGCIAISSLFGGCLLLAEHWRSKWDPLPANDFDHCNVKSS